jgi:hypothetical protein
MQLDFYSEECERLSRKFMEKRKASKEPFLRTLFLANQLRWDAMMDSIIASLHRLRDLACGECEEVR